MSEAFEVPEPSEEAKRIFYEMAKRAVVRMEFPKKGSIFSPDSLTDTVPPLRAAYAVDVPGIVRAEVQRVIRMACVAAREAFPISATDSRDDDFEMRLRAKVNERFPEAAPESHGSRSCWFVWHPEGDAPIPCTLLRGHTGPHKCPAPRGAPEPKKQVCDCPPNPGHPWCPKCPLRTPSAPVERPLKVTVYRSADMSQLRHICFEGDGRGLHLVVLDGAPPPVKEGIRIEASGVLLDSAAASEALAGSVPEPEGYQCIGCGARSVRLADFQHLDDCAIGGARVVPVGVAEPKGETVDVFGDGRVKVSRDTTCTACACPRCTAMEAFTGEWVRVVAYHAHECTWRTNGGYEKHPAVVAARKVVGYPGGTMAEEP